MKVDVEDISGIEKKVSVEIPAEQVKDEFELAYKEVQKEAKIRGFRPGHAPRKIIELNFKDYVSEKVLKKLFEESFSPALDRKQLKPIIEPEVTFSELKPDAPFSYTMTVELKPVVELKEYKGFELERDVYTIDEKNIDHALEEMRERNAMFVEPKEARAVKDTDLLTLDLKVEVDGKAMTQLSGEGLQYTMGDKVYIPEFAQELAGMRVGEKRDFKVSYPADSEQKELAGKEVVYHAELKGLKEKILPELNDEFAKEFGGHDHLADLRKKVGEDLETYLKRASRVKAERELLDKLVEKNPLEVPKGLVKRHAEEMAKQNLNRMGIKEATKEDIGHFTEQFMARAEKEIKAGFLLEAIISSEKIELAGEDEGKKLKELSEQYKIDESKLKDQLGEETLKHFRAQWLEDKALDFLFSQSKIKDKKVSADEAHSHAHHEHEEHDHEHEGEEGKA